MFAVYEQNRAEGRPNFITEDFVLLGYSRALDHEMAAFEERGLLPAVRGIVGGLLKAFPAKRSQSEEQAFAFLTVVDALASGETPSAPPAAVEELARIREAGGIRRSDLVSQSLDYSQFKPRGHYTQSEALGRYFVAIRYAGTVLFPVLPSEATGITAADADSLTAQALVLARLIASHPKIAAEYHLFGTRLDALVGPAEDLEVGDLSAIPAAMPVEQARQKLLAEARRLHRQPAILASPVDTGKLEAGVSAADALTGWRMFPLRYTSDSAALQQLVYDRVKAYKGNGKPNSLAVIGGQSVKGFPQAREIMALLGSKQAVQELDATDERNYEGYEAAFQKAAQILSAGHDFGAEQLRMIQKFLLADPGADPAQRLRTALALWTWNRYNTSLYAKQSYTAVAKGMMPMRKREAAWIEPSAGLYQGLADQTTRLAASLPGSRLGEVAAIFKRCAEIARSEAKGAPPNAVDAKFLNELDITLKGLTGGADRPIVIDVHTEPNSGMVLEEGIGFPIVVEHDLGGTPAVGARFRHVEFKQKMSARLNDEEWEIQLEKESMK
jgi:hypothetical protein